MSKIDLSKISKEAWPNNMGNFAENLKTKLEPKLGKKLRVTHYYHDDGYGSEYDVFFTYEIKPESNFLGRIFRRTLIAVSSEGFFGGDHTCYSVFVNSKVIDRDLAKETIEEITGPRHPGYLIDYN